MKDNFNGIIEEAKKEDLESIFLIWKEGVSYQSILSGDIHINEKEAKTILEHQIENQNDHFKFWTIKNNEGEIMGWQSILPFHSSPIPLVKNSFGQSSTYIHKGFQRKGLGKKLLKHALAYCASSTEIKYVFGIILTLNTKSLQLCSELGFQNLGVLPNKNKEIRDFNLVVFSC